MADKKMPPGVKLGSDYRIEAIPRFYNDVFVGHGVNVLGGRSGASKTTNVAGIVAEFTAAGRYAACSMKEGSPAHFLAQVRASGGDPSLVLMLHDLDLKFPRDTAQLEEILVHFDAALFVGDTAAKHLDVPLGSPKAGTACLYLDRMAYRTRVPQLWITHTIKSATKNGEPLDAFGGTTSGFVGSAAVAAVFGKCKADGSPDAPAQRAMAVVKDRYGPGERVLLFDLDSEEVTDDSTGERAEAAYLALADDNLAVTDFRAYAMELIIGGVEGKRGPDASAKLDAAEFLSTVLALGPVPVNTYTDPQHGIVEGLRERAKAEGLSWASVRRAKDECGILAEKSIKPAGSTKGGEYKWAWRLPDNHPALAGNNAATATP